MKSLFKRFLGNAALTRLAAARLAGSVLILGYHDIGPNNGPGNWLRVRQREFDRQLTWMARFGRFITPDELPVVVAEVGDGSATDGNAGERRAAGIGRAAATSSDLRFLLTFDDGYVNNYRVALPILKRHGVPALFFVSTWHAATGESFWFDRVAVPIQADAMGELDLREVGLKLYRFHPSDGPQRWDDIHRLLADIKALGNPGHPVVDQILLRCQEATGERGRAALVDCRPLRVDEIRAMRASGLCHFGSHAHRHEILTHLDDSALAEALRASHEFLETTLLTPPYDLAYPNGDADERVFAAAEAAGFGRGYTTADGVTRPQTAPLRLPRLLIGGYDTPSVLAFKLNRLLLRAAMVSGTQHGNGSRAGEE